MSSSEPILRVTGLSKCYQIFERPQDRLKQPLMARLRSLVGKEPLSYFRQFWALSDVTFSLSAGETVGVIGRNGSGKSTLLQIVCGTTTPTHGTVEVGGRVAALLELGAGFNPEFTGRENVILNAGVLGIPPAEVERRMDDILAFADIGDFVDQPTRTYSSGMYVRLAFAVAVSVDPQILIVDEALAVGDARFQAKCMKRIRDMQDGGTAILFVSHDVAAVRTLCQRAIWLESGALRMTGDVFRVTSSYMEFMLGADREASGEVPNSYADTAAETSGLDGKPVTHWGAHIGSITSAGVVDEAGRRVDLVRWNEVIRVVISVTLPPGLDRKSLGVAFSIKDLRGTDLIVSTTLDRGEIALEAVDGDRVEVEFQFRNPLVSGRYVLVAALEDRSSGVIQYGEYIEGAQYFSSMSDDRFFGLFQPPIKQSLATNAK